MCNVTKKSKKNENDKIPFLLKINNNYARYILRTHLPKNQTSNTRNMAI